MGIIILIPLAAALSLRSPLERRYVDRAAPIRRTALQFRLDLGLYLAAGLVMALILLLRYHFPLLQSGMKLVLGVFTVGLFAALDLALARERDVIHLAHHHGPFSPPKELTPLSKRFILVTAVILGLITAILLLVLIRDVNWLASQGLNQESIGTLGRSVLQEILFIMGFLLLMTINLVFSFARNLKILFHSETRVLKAVSRGDLSRRVPVATSDELGVIAGYTNTMIAALHEGVRMREGLLIAQEVQRNFLPDESPELPGLDIAGSATFSDETGGDFYDFVHCEPDGCSRITLLVGDVSGHGIGAALLMASGRATLRQSVNQDAGLARNIAAANIHLSRDLDGTGRFITLFALGLNPLERTVSWVNAGHQPALLYDPASDLFAQLKGVDIPLGVMEDWDYHEFSLPYPKPGQVLLILTDGVPEAHSPDGEMFGQERLLETIRGNAERDAEGIIRAVSQAVAGFTRNAVLEDDLTLVAIKGI
nr:SpoIIE family protein phosphatase [Pseudodesulfovibrio cashew]